MTASDQNTPFQFALGMSAHAESVGWTARERRVAMRLGAKPVDGISAGAIVATGVGIGREEFDSSFASWGLADLDGWYQRRDPARTFDSFAKARAWAFGR